jgi:excinuclease ABC subunit A
MNEVPCAACRGTRLQPQARAVRVTGQGISDLIGLSVDAAVDRLHGLTLTKRDGVIANQY